MLNFLSLRNDSFGIDIGDRSLKIAKLFFQGKDSQLSSWGEFEIPAGLVKQGEIKDEDALAKLIQDSVKKVRGRKITTKYVVASLPEDRAFLEVIRMPKMEEREMRNAVYFEAENHIPLPLENICLDFQRVPSLQGNLDHEDILLVALPREVVIPYVSCLKKAGFIPCVLETESQALVRSVVKNSVSPFPILLIDLGRTATSFVIFSGYSTRFTASSTFSSQDFTQALAQILKIDVQEAEGLKIQYGLRLPEKILVEKYKKNLSKEEIIEALSPAFVALTNDINRYLDYYQSHSSHEHLTKTGGKIGKIILCGGGAGLQGLSELLAASLKIPVEIGNPWVNILTEPSKEIPQLSFSQSLGYAPVLGLALRALQEEKYD